MKDLTLIANDLTKKYGTKDTLKARLMDNNSPLINYNLTFNINGVDYVRTTDSQGYASLNINLLPGTYPATITFFGNATYNSKSVMVLVRVVQENTPQSNLKNAENYFECNHIPLKVLLKDGFDVKPGQNIKETPLLPDKNYNAPSFYFNSGYEGDEFEISVYMTEYYFYNNQQVMSYLNGWNKINSVVTVITDSMVVANGKYTMQIKDKSQTSKGYSIWKLRFKQYYENSLSFDSMFDTKIASLSSIDQLLLKQTNGINNKSPKNVILAFQQKLQEQACWDNVLRDTSKMGNPGIISGAEFKVRKPQGIWDGQMQYDIYLLQNKLGLNATTNKNGVCDYETITTLIQYTNGS